VHIINENIRSAKKDKFLKRNICMGGGPQRKKRRNLVFKQDAQKKITVVPSGVKYRGIRHFTRQGKLIRPLGGTEKPKEEHQGHRRYQSLLKRPHGENRPAFPKRPIKQGGVTKANKRTLQRQGRTGHRGRYKRSTTCTRKQIGPATDINEPITASRNQERANQTTEGRERGKRCEICVG